MRMRLSSDSIRFSKLEVHRLARQSLDHSMVTMEKQWRTKRRARSRREEQAWELEASLSSLEQLPRGTNHTNNTCFQAARPTSQFSEQLLHFSTAEQASLQCHHLIRWRVSGGNSCPILRPASFLCRSIRCAWLSHGAHNTLSFRRSTESS